MLIRTHPKTFLQFILNLCSNPISFLKVSKAHMIFVKETFTERRGYPLCYWWLIWSIQNDEKKLRNNWNPGTWVLTWECSMTAIQWILTWKDLEGFQKSLHPCALDKIAPVLEGLIMFFYAVCRSRFLARTPPPYINTSPSARWIRFPVLTRGNTVDTLHNLPLPPGISIPRTGGFPAIMQVALAGGHHSLSQQDIWASFRRPNP